MSPASFTREAREDLLAIHDFIAESSLERAVTMLTETPIQPEFLAEAQFALARTLDALGREGERARALARDSQRGYAESGGYPRELAEVERWIERHAK